MQNNEILSPAHGAEQDRPSCWIAVACADHVLRGVAGGFMQVCHGKAAPLQRIKAGDWVAYYSPSHQMGKSDGLCSITALGRVKLGEPYSFDMGKGFVPFRRDVRWLAAQTASIKPLLPLMAWTQGKSRWAAPLRFGLLRIGFEDMQRIAHAMQAKRWRDVS